jgi:hypothetical protein
MIDFDHPGDESPSVDLSLPGETVRDLAGLGDAALAGVAEALIRAGGASDKAVEVKMAAEGLADIRKLVTTVQGALQQLHVQVYRNASSESFAQQVSGHYTQKLKGSSWDKLVVAHEGSESATVYVLRQSGAFRGVLVIATNGKELVLANAACDLSPERVQQVADQAVSLAVKFGGEEALGKIVEKLGKKK